MSNKDAGTTAVANVKVDKQAVRNAVKLIEDSYMDISEMRDTLKLTSYQYARQMIITNRYGLGDNTIEVMGRKFVSRDAVAKALQTRRERLAEEKAQTA